jgi:Lipopolysaccharide kinase (Kdo/WaaP) family
VKLPAEFAELRHGIVVRRGYEAELAGWLEQAPAVADEAAVAGGRGATRVVALAAGGRAFVRRYVHGGLLGTLLRDLYWQRPPRPLRELVATEAARAAGVVAPEVLAAAALPGVGRSAGWLYRGLLVTRALEGRRALGEALRAASEAERSAWIGCAVRAIRRLHAAGIHHPDLNVANVLVAAAADAPAALIDFDRASVRPRPLDALHTALACRRLARSIAKLALPGLDRAGAARALRAAGLGTPP